MRKPIVIVESPYAGAVEENVAYARAAVKDCLLRGEVPLASHLLYTQPDVLNDDVEEERALGIEAGLTCYHVADYVVFYIDRGWSRGMHAARARAEEVGIPYHYRRLSEV